MGASPRGPKTKARRYIDRLSSVADEPMPRSLLICVRAGAIILAELVDTRPRRDIKAVMISFRLSGQL
jgi:hypothetical protein